MATFESVLLVKNEVFVYRIPARTSNRGYSIACNTSSDVDDAHSCITQLVRIPSQGSSFKFISHGAGLAPVRAAEWNLDKPDWVGRLRVVALNKEITVKLEDKNSGELFAQCPVESYPGTSVEQVLDSSRYFVLRIKDPSGRSAFIGVGFADRGDSFDLLVSIQDHFKWVKREEKEETSAASFDPGPKLDLGFKEGQTIKINIATKKDGESATKSRPKATAGGTGLLPPPPGGVKLPGPPKATNDNFLSQPAPSNSTTSSSGQSSDLLCDFGAPSQPAATQPAVTQSSNSDAWGDFTGAQSGGTGDTKTGDGWVQF